MSDMRSRIYLLVKQIPAGRVATYGQIARLVGPPCDAREVGSAMAALGPNTDVPWQRVINSQGGISTRGYRQRALLEAEGIEFNEKSLTNLKRFGWKGPEFAWLVENGFTPLAPPEEEEPPPPPEQLSLL
ncbi:MAG: MGMT family protein [Anaerolineae bacterium]|nr:MGMT family protein [Anaerolineae bacterium]